jgi:hypothetical protein
VSLKEVAAAAHYGSRAANGVIKDYYFKSGKNQKDLCEAAQ